MNKTDLSKVRVLVIDDSKSMVAIVKTMLRGFGITNIRESLNPKDALGIVQSEIIDLIIVDYLMHPMDGVEFVKTVRQNKQSGNALVPIIMITAFSEMSKVILARDAGITEFCCKPFSSTDLYMRLIAIVNRPRAFIRTKNYFGPDRRRNSKILYRGPDRREQEKAEKDAQEQEAETSPASPIDQSDGAEKALAASESGS